MIRLVVIFCLLTSVAAPAALSKPSPRHAALHRYLVKIGPEISSYRSIGASVQKLLDKPPVANVDPLVATLYGIATRFGELSGRWRSIEAPTGLGVRHAGMGRVFELYDQGIHLYAAALFTRHVDEINAATRQLHDYLRSATYLQRRWAAALRGALIRADLKVPEWLNGMATAEIS